jgi:uncharacterized protein YacL
MDFLAIAKAGNVLAESLTKKYSLPIGHFTQSEDLKTQSSGFNVANILSFILSIVVGLYAAYLSWQCNTNIDYNIFLKVIFAIFAFLFGLVYLILYVIMRLDTCSVIAKSKR